MSSQPELVILYTRQEIKAAVKKLATSITEDYRNKNSLLIGILKGSFIFMADLVRFLDFPIEIEFVQLSSYGRGRTTTGGLSVVQGLRSQIEGRDVLVIENIVDSGKTVSFLIDYLLKEKPTSLKLCALLDKPSRRQVSVDIDYLGITVPDRFLVGYGLDWDEKYRNLQDIGYLKEY